MPQNIKKTNLVFIGPYPPPLGGVSVHIDRLKNLMKDNFSIEVIDESRTKKEGIFNFRSLNIIKYFLIVLKANIIHIHSGTSFLRFCHIIVARLLTKYVVVTVHSYKSVNKKKIAKWFDKKLLLKANKVIFVSDEIANQFKITKAITKNAFLPAYNNFDKLDSEIEFWLSKKKENGFIICAANASKLILYNNEDLYGLDLCINAAIYFKKQQLKICIIFTISDIGNSIDADIFIKKISENDLSEHIYLHPSSLNFITLIQKSDIILRPTNSDGDSLTVREALFFKKRVIASDIVKRPIGVTYFKNRDLNSFITMITDISKEIFEEGSSKKILPLDDYKSFYTKIYSKNNQ